MKINLGDYKFLFNGLISAALVTLINKFNAQGLWKLLLLGVVFVFVAAFLQGLVSFLKRKEAHLYFKSKVREFLHLLLGDKYTYINSNYKFDCYELHEKHKNCIELIKDVICNNQGLFANFSYMCGEKHKKMREELDKADPNGDAVSQYFKDLSDFMRNGFDVAARTNVKRMEEYFNGRSAHNPRVVIKGHKDGFIKDIYREDYQYKTEYRISANTGFEHVYKKGSVFLCNDIPSAAADDIYFNPRLINRKARNYVTYLKNDKKTYDHEQWIDCWERLHYESDDTYKQPSPESCYKSTLIVPMTLYNNAELSDDFRRHFEIPKPTGTMQTNADDKDIGRAVFGFLCFDHIEKNYFTNLDIKVGYLFADLLCLYVIDMLKYSTFSAKFKVAEDMLKNGK